MTRMRGADPGLNVVRGRVPAKSRRMAMKSRFRRRSRGRDKRRLHSGRFRRGRRLPVAVRRQVFKIRILDVVKLLRGRPRGGRRQRVLAAATSRGRRDNPPNDLDDPDEKKNESNPRKKTYHRLSFISSAPGCNTPPPHGWDGISAAPDPRTAPRRRQNQSPPRSR